MKNNIYFRLSIFVFISLAVAFFMLPSDLLAAEKVKVGYLIPLSGTAASSIGQDMSRGTHLAIKHINESGGIKSLGGAQLELVEIDTHGDPKVGMTEAERLIKLTKQPTNESLNY